MYFVFTWDNYYPRGGANDLLGSASTLEEARKMAANPPNYDENYQITDACLDVVEEGDIASLRSCLA